MNNLKRTSSRKKGYSTLVNKTNTCFMNCVIQALANDYKFAKYIKNQKIDTVEVFYDSESDSESCVYSEIDNYVGREILYNFIKLIKTMWKTNMIITPSTFNRVFMSKYKKYTPNFQHDAKEFLLDLLEEIHISLSQKCIGIVTSEFSSKHYNSALKENRDYFENEKSYISDNFYGQFIQSFTCENCDMIHYKYDPFITINIKARSEHVEKLILESMKLDYINSECEECIKYDMPKGVDPSEIPDHIRNREHRVETSIYSLPETLIVSVDCFTNDSKKILSPVIIDTELDLYKKVITNTDEPVVYTLSSIIYHIGKKLSNGHFVTLVRRDDINATDSYVLFDDSVYSKIELSALDKTGCTPYLLFYSRKTKK